MSESESLTTRTGMLERLARTYHGRVILGAYLDELDEVPSASALKEAAVVGRLLSTPVAGARWN